MFPEDYPPNKHLVSFRFFSGFVLFLVWVNLVFPFGIWVWVKFHQDDSFSVFNWGIKFLSLPKSYLVKKVETLEPKFLSLFNLWGF